MFHPWKDVMKNMCSHMINYYIVKERAVSSNDVVGVTRAPYFRKVRPEAG